MDEIVNMLQPQFVLDLKLITVNNKRISNFTVTNSNSNLRAPKEENREWIYVPSSVPRSSDHLILTFIVDDINDNKPVFDQGETLVVGYPTKDLAQQMAPPYLTQVHATDKDVGINAEIAYHTNSKNFIIHRKTGVIYPCDDAFANDLKFTVTATDLDGDTENGLSTDLEIEVNVNVPFSF
ncbi:hypothetical protein ILUMI_08693 [Ignelater luminosus]|uniref:Cadherin domain-containing protein n=1 Tax=Ignelater luminosus TaxID=2038154 RepID=A0A8K0D5N6_IGNLU|nr:hypothetical protein ILUMI_08693 [Ignelater luminosus]